MKTPKNKFGLFPFKIELILFVVVLLFAFGFNAYAVVSSGMDAQQIWTSWKAPLIIAVGIYVSSVMIRALLMFFGKSVESFQKFGQADDF